jgi:DNA-binding MarR family transcriptional regulator
MIINTYNNNIFINKHQNKENKSSNNSISNEVNLSSRKLLMPNIDLVNFTGTISKCSKLSSKKDVLNQIKTNPLLLEDNLFKKLKNTFNLELSEYDGMIIYYFKNFHDSPVKLIITIQEISNNLKISKDTVSKTVNKLTEAGLIEPIKNGSITRHCLTLEFNKLLLEKTPIKTKQLIFDKKYWNEKLELSSIIQKKYQNAVQKREEGDNIIINIEKDLDSVSKLMETIIEKQIPSILIIPTKDKKSLVVPSGIKAVYADYIEDIKYKGLSSEFISENKIGSDAQQMIEFLSKQKKLLYKSQIKGGISIITDHRINKALDELKKTGLIEFARSKYPFREGYRITDKYQTEFEQNISLSPDITALHENIM